MRAAAAGARQRGAAGDSGAAARPPRAHRDRRQRGRGPQPAAARIERFAALHSERADRRPARPVPPDCERHVLDRSLDFGVLTFQPADRGVPERFRSAATRSCCSRRRSTRLARRGVVTLEEVGREVVIAATATRRPRATAFCARMNANRRRSANIQIALPSPRRHQARGRDRRRRRAPAAPLRADGDRARPSGRRPRAGAGCPASGHGGVQKDRRAQPSRGGLSRSRQNRRLTSGLEAPAAHALTPRSRSTRRLSVKKPRNP